MRRLIVCADGTWKTAEAEDVTNVVLLAHAIAPTDRTGISQIVFYDAGVGTGTVVDRLTGGAFGRGLSDNVRDCYRFFVQNYQDNDHIFFFGFSRGAYTVRSAVGLIRKCGLLRQEHAEKLDEAYALYRKRDDTADTPEAVAFRRNYSKEIQVEFVGVFDTVGALGVPMVGLRALTRWRYRFHDTKLSRIVNRACHAVAIDERPIANCVHPSVTQRQNDPMLVYRSDNLMRYWASGSQCVATPPGPIVPAPVPASPPAVVTPGSAASNP